MYCYGHYSVQKSQCAACDLAAYCKEAADPPLMVANMPNYNDELAPPPRPARDPAPVEVYTRDDLLELVASLLAMDEKAVELVAMHVASPAITFQAMADARGITKQGVHKFLKNQCRKVPELASLLKICERRRNNIKRKTFMEAVCLIRKKTSALRSQKPRKSLLCWKSLIFSTESSSLSNTNIIKGARRWKST